jgi:hypothetical protein
VIKLSEIPDAIAPIVPMLQGQMTIPPVKKDPLAMPDPKSR